MLRMNCANKLHFVTVIWASVNTSGVQLKTDNLKIVFKVLDRLPLEQTTKKVVDLIVEVRAEFPWLVRPSKDTCETLSGYIKWFSG